MEERPFMDSSIQPTDLSLRSCLGSVFALYQEVLEQVYQFSQAWSWTKGSGWMLKVSDQKKALFYLIPLHQAFRISLTLRENERTSFLQDRMLSDFSDRLISAKKFVEGFAVSFEISTREDLERFLIFIHKLIGLRRKA
jgi:hypothetical protein